MKGEKRISIEKRQLPPFSLTSTVSFSSIHTQIYARSYFHLDKRLFLLHLQAYLRGQEFLTILHYYTDSSVPSCSDNGVVRSRKRNYNMYVYKIENSQDCDEKEKTVTVTLRMLISYFLRKERKILFQDIFTTLSLWHAIYVI